MRQRLLFALALAALGCGVACSCGERGVPANRAGDSGTEAAARGAGSAAAAELPANAVRGLPDDIPIPEGLRTTSVSSEEAGSLVALFTGELEPEEVARVFAEGLRQRGWQIDESHRTGDDLGLFARKEQRIASVVVTRLSGKLHVELGVWSPRN